MYVCITYLRIWEYVDLIEIEAAGIFSCSDSELLIF